MGTIGAVWQDVRGIRDLFDPDECRNLEAIGYGDLMFQGVKYTD